MSATRLLDDLQICEVPYVKLTDERNEESHAKLNKPKDIVIAINEEKKENFDEIIDTEKLRALQYSETPVTTIKYDDTDEILRKLEEQTDEARSLFIDFHCTTGFSLSLIIFLGSAAGAITLGVIENRWDGPFFATACAGITEFILGILAFASCAASCNSNTSCLFICSIPLLWALIALQTAIESYYVRAIEPVQPIDPEHPTGYAEGAGILGLIALISSVTTCGSFLISCVRERPFSKAEKDKHISAQENVGIFPVVATDNPKEYPEVAGMLESARRALSKERQRLGNYKGTLFKALPQEIPKICKELIFQYAYQPRGSIPQIVERYRSKPR